MQTNMEHSGIWMDLVDALPGPLQIDLSKCTHIELLLPHAHRVVVSAGSQDRPHHIPLNPPHLRSIHPAILHLVHDLANTPSSSFPLAGSRKCEYYRPTSHAISMITELAVATVS